MKCWKCGKDIADGTSVCVYCHTDQRREPPKTEVGRAMRTIYDTHGAENVLSTPTVLVNGIGDLVEDSKKLRNQLRTAMDAGVGRIYLEQLQISGSTDESFDRLIKKVLTEDADMNEKDADRLMGWFDEMIGWKLPKTEPVEPPAKPPIPSGKKSLPAWIRILILLAAGALCYFIYQNNQMPTATVKASVKVGDIVTFGSYEQDHYSGADPIEWQVLAVENGRALLLSRYALETKRYHNTRTDVIWEKSDLRTWLNGDFYNSTFTSSEQSKIVQVWNSNLDNPDYGTEGGNDTSDRIFLLSIDEVQKYLPTESDRQCQATYIAKQNGAYVADNGYSWWWLRSPGSTSSSAADVDFTGYVDTLGYGVHIDDEAVRPALWLNL